MVTKENKSRLLTTGERYIEEALMDVQVLLRFRKLSTETHFDYKPKLFNDGFKGFVYNLQTENLNTRTIFF